IANVAHLLAAPSAVAPGLGASGIDGQASQTLRDVIVQLARESRALGFLRRDEPAAQLARHALRLLPLGHVADKRSKNPALGQHDFAHGQVDREEGTVLAPSPDCATVLGRSWF